MFCIRYLELSKYFFKYLFVVIVCMKYGKAQQAQFASPCPSLFVYDEKSNEVGKWYGIITLLSETDLNGIWLRIILDRPSVQLGNWFGQVTSTDNKEFLIKNRNFSLKALTSHAVRFYIKYNVGEPVPQLLSFRVNAKTLCPEGVPQEGPEYTSELQGSGNNVQKPTSKPVKRPDGGGTASGIPGGSTSNENDDGVYPGDFYKPFLEGSSNADLNTDCGTVAVQSKSQGQSAVEGEFPWQIAVYYLKGIDLAYICAGTLISKDHVISAAHCLTRKQSKTALNIDSFMIYLGKHFLRRWSNVGVQDRQISSIVIHPSYNPQTFDNDLGVIRLALSADITDYVRPICLWQESGDFSSIANKQGTVAGWGYDESGKITEQLMQAKMAPVSIETCSPSLKYPSTYFTSKTMYCAGFVKGTSACIGNSGSGLAFTHSKANAGRLVWQLRGVVAISAALQNQYKCDTSQFVVFVDIAKHLDWIKQAMTKIM